MLSAAGIGKVYAPKIAVRNVGFAAPPGQVLGLLGPNGSGKSTTIGMLAGLLDPTWGTIEYLGRPIRDDLASYKSVVGYVPEEPNLYGWLTGRECLTLVAGLRGIPRARADALADRLLTLLELGHSADAVVSSYSKGMRQKVLLACALLHNPRILILDEPCSGLDLASMVVLHSVIRELARKGTIVIYSSHSLEQVEAVCDELIILFEGHVVAKGSPGELKTASPDRSLSTAFLHVANRVDTENVARSLVAAIGG